jgi:hypothetical protein
MNKNIYYSKNARADRVRVRQEKATLRAVVQFLTIPVSIYLADQEVVQFLTLARENIILTNMYRHMRKYNSEIAWLTCTGTP